MEYWYLVALANVVLLAILRLLFQSAHQLHHTSGDGLAAPRMVRGIVR
jgi:hypothetical protein